MPLRRPVLIGSAAVFAALAAMSSPSFAEKKTLREFLFPSLAAKAEKVEEPAKPGKKVKLKTAKAKKGKGAAVKEVAAKPAKGGELPGVRSRVRKQGEVEPEVMASVSGGNNGELRSETAPKRVGLFSALFGAKPQATAMLPQTRALDSVLAQKESRKKFKVKDDFLPQQVEFSGYAAGTIVIDTRTRYLYLVETRSTARRYAIAVGREGLLFTGRATVGDKQEWPRWIPTADMQKREPRKYGQYKDGMPGGPENPLGARAIYLYQGKRDTHIRIHGTNQPQSIGRAASNGCFRMVNEHVMDLYNRVRTGTPVIVL